MVKSRNDLKIELWLQLLHIQDLTIMISSRIIHYRVTSNLPTSNLMETPKPVKRVYIQITCRADVAEAIHTLVYNEIKKESHSSLYDEALDDIEQYSTKVWDEV